MHPTRSRFILPQQGFTFVELMVVIIILGILAATAVPIYIALVERAKLVEATSNIGAIISSEKLERQRHPSTGFYSASTVDAFEARGLDLSEAKYFAYEVSADGNTPADSFIVTARATAQYSQDPSGCYIQYSYDPSRVPAGQWSADGTCITDDMLP